MEVLNGNIEIGSQYIRSSNPTDISTYVVRNVSPRKVLLANNAGKELIWISKEDFNKDYTLI